MLKNIFMLVYQIRPSMLGNTKSMQPWNIHDSKKFSPMIRDIS